MLDKLPEDVVVRHLLPYLPFEDTVFVFYASANIKRIIAHHAPKLFKDSIYIFSPPAWPLTGSVDISKQKGFCVTGFSPFFGQMIPINNPDPTKWINKKTKPFFKATFYTLLASVTLENLSIDELKVIDEGIPIEMEKLTISFQPEPTRVSNEVGIVLSYIIGTRRIKQLYAQAPVLEAVRRFMKLDMVAEVFRVKMIQPPPSASCSKPMCPEEESATMRRLEEFYRF